MSRYRGTQAYHVLRIRSNLSDDCTAWSTTHNIGYQKPQKVHSVGSVNKDSKKDVGGTSNSK